MTTGEAASLDDGRQLRRGQAGGHGLRDGAELPDGDDGDEPVHRVGQRDRDHVAEADALGSQATGQSIGAVLELGPGDRLVPARDRRSVRGRGGEVGEPAGIGDEAIALTIGRSSRSARPIGAAERAGQGSGRRSLGAAARRRGTLMADGGNGILRLLDLEQVDEDAFVAPTPTEGPGRLFGGQVASQSLRAACLTVEAGRPPHSLHAYFILRGGRASRCGSTSSAAVTAGRSPPARHRQPERDADLRAGASFHAPEDGFDWQLPGPSGVTPPEEIDPPVLPDFLRATIPFDMRLATTPEPGGFPIAHPFLDPLPDPARRRPGPARLRDDVPVRHGRRGQRPGPRVADGPVLRRQPRSRGLVPPPGPGRRVAALLRRSGDQLRRPGLARGTLHTQAGVHVASIAQEALLRPAGEQRMA